MSIKPSAAAEIRALVEALGSSDDVRRESAIARLAVIGERAVDRLLAAYPSADRQTRIAILRAAEAIADPRVVELGVEALRSGGDLAVAGAATLRAILDAPVDAAANRALDALVETAVDRGADRHVRIAAFDALSTMPASVREPVAEALRKDPDGVVRNRAASGPGDAAAADAAWQDAIDGRLPDDPGALLEAVRRRGGSAPLGSLQKLVEAIRARESGPDADRSRAWQQVRGATHQALALRGSRVAVYDLRETVAVTESPLPAAFMAALHVLGEESCLEPVAAAWTASTDAGWRHQLEGALLAIVRREKISRRSAAWKRLRTRYPDATSRFDQLVR